MGKDTDIFLTQAEVAKRWKCTESTVKNYRDRGLLSCFHPGALVRYFKKDIIEFEKKHTINWEGGDQPQTSAKAIKGMPVISYQKNEDWRI